MVPSFSRIALGLYRTAKTRPRGVYYVLRSHLTPTGLLRLSQPFVSKQFFPSGNIRQSPVSHEVIQLSRSYAHIAKLYTQSMYYSRIEAWYHIYSFSAFRSLSET